jgi:hypothetical protein
VTGFAGRRTQELVAQGYEFVYFFIARAGCVVGSGDGHEIGSQADDHGTGKKENSSPPPTRMVPTHADSLPLRTVDPFLFRA